MTGTAEIVTDDLRVMQRIFNQFNKLFDKIPMPTLLCQAHCQNKSRKVGTSFANKLSTLPHHETMHIHTTWAKIKWAFVGYYTLVLFIYFCGG